MEVVPPGDGRILREVAGGDGLSLAKLMVEISDLFVIFGLWGAGAGPSLPNKWD